MNKNLKKLTLWVLTATFFSTIGITAMAIDRRVEDSGHRVIKTSSGVCYASGFVKAKQYHYTNVRVFSGSQMRESGRVYGTGTVSAQTPSVAIYDPVGSAVYYGF